jgi:hypothetical protein
MNPWQALFFGLKQIPRELTAFEIEAQLRMGIAAAFTMQALPERNYSRLKGMLRCLYY